MNGLQDECALVLRAQSMRASWWDTTHAALGDGSFTGVSTGATVEVEGALVESPAKSSGGRSKRTQVRLVGAADPKTYPCKRNGTPMNFCGASRLCARSVYRPATACS
jgi:hypothetical protein